VQPQQYEKMEKVDILELTVGYLRELRRMHMNRLPLVPIQQQQQHQHPHPHQQQQQQQQLQYREGYQSAMNEARELLARHYGMPELGNRLVSHLRGDASAAGHPSPAGTTLTSTTVPSGYSRMSTPAHQRAPYHHQASPALFTPRVLFSPGHASMTSPSSAAATRLKMTSRSTHTSSSSSHFLSPPYTLLRHQRQPAAETTVKTSCELEEQMEEVVKHEHSVDEGTDSAVHSASDASSLRLDSSDVNQSTSSGIFSSPRDVSDPSLELSPQCVWRPF
jgi:hypothetical protein